MLRICAVLDILVLLALILDYLKTSKYLEEQERLKQDVRKMHYEICELEDQLRSR